MKLIADIASGNTEFADIMFLVAFILGLIAAIAHYTAQTAKHTVALVAVAVAALGLGFLVL